MKIRFFKLMNTVKYIFSNFKAIDTEVKLMVVLICSILGLGIIYMINLNMSNVLYEISMIIVGMSFGIFVSDGFKFSDFTIVRIIQKMVLWSFIILFIFYIICNIIIWSADPVYYSYIETIVHKVIELIVPTAECSGIEENNNINPEASTSSNSAESSNNINQNTKSGGSVNVNRTGDGEVSATFSMSERAIIEAARVIKQGVETGARDIGLYAAGGVLSKTIFTSPAVANLSLTGKIAASVAGGSSLVGGLKTASIAADNMGRSGRNRAILDEAMRKSAEEGSKASELPKSNNFDSQSLIDSLSDFSFGFNDSMSPIEVLIYSSYLLNIFKLIIFISCIYLIIVNYIRKYNLLINVLKSILPNSINQWFIKIISVGNKGFETFVKYSIIFNLAILLFLIVLNLYISTELYYYLDDYIKVHMILNKTNISIIPFIFSFKKNKNLTLQYISINNNRYFYSSISNNNSTDSINLSSDNSPQDVINLKNNSNKINMSNGVHYWKEFVINTPGGFLTENLIGYLTKKFFIEVVNPSFESYKQITYCSILKVVFKDGSVRCISNMVIITRKNNVNNLVKIFIDYWNLRSENYHLQEVKKIFISYRTFHVNDISKIEIFKNKLLNLSEEGNSNEYENFQYTGYKLPNTTDLSKWGMRLSQKEGSSQLFSPIGRSKTNNIMYNIFPQKLKNIVQVFSEDRLMLEFEDILTNGIDNPSTFKRVMKNATIFYKDGIRVKEIVNRKLKFIKPISKDFYLNESFITLDIETKNINGELSPICISIYDGKEIQSFYILDYKSDFDMFKAAFDFLNKRKYHYNRVYIHNLSKFDGVFLLKYLSSIGDVKPLMRNQSLYEIKIRLFSENKQKYLIMLRDSYLILPSSLSKLSKAFKISNPKTIFPIFAVNELPLNYIGILPNVNQFLSENDYINYNSQFKSTTDDWNLRTELIKYCENDVISLHQIIQKFSGEIFDMFRLDMHKYLTLSSIAFAIYRSNYLKNVNLIPKINGQMFKDIYQSYKGGLVDMFIPEGTNLFSMDVNSEYPEAMCKDMPGGPVQFIKGDINLKDNSIFGFYKAEVIAPVNLNMPVLPIKYKGRTITALGKWTDWYFTEELREAEKYGYEIKLLQGYNFQRKSLFKNFVEDLYSIKEETSKDDPKYTITKFILNMTYGRFGMNPDKDETVLVSKEKAIDFLLDPNKDIKEHFVFENKSEFIKYSQIISEEKLDNNYHLPSVSIAIASAVVAYGRMKINMLKHLEGMSTYYSDTDSIFTNKLLSEEFIGNKLGQLKLENNIKIAYFIAPKVYCIITQDNKVICKVKGLKANMSFYEFNMILYKNTTITKYQEKWYRKWEEGKIYIRHELYSLVVTDNKRQLIYNSCSKLVATKPYIYVDGEIINKDIGYILNIKEPDNKLTPIPS